MDMDRKESPALQPLDMLMVPATDRTLVFEDEFMLCDNLNRPADAGIGRQFIAPDRPFKMDFTLLMFCTQGEMRLRLNLQEYRLQGGMALVVLPGDIGECLAFGPDCQVALIAFSDDAYTDGARSVQSMRFLKYLTKQRLIPLTPEEMQEVLSVYQWMRRKIAQPDFGFTRGIVRCYMLVLVHNGYQWLARHHREQPDAERPQNRPQELFESVPDAQIPVQRGAPRQRPPRGRVDQGLCAAGGQSPPEEPPIHGAAGERDAELPQHVVFREVLQEGGGMHTADIYAGVGTHSPNNHRFSHLLIYTFATANPAPITAPASTSVG